MWITQGDFEKVFCQEFLVEERRRRILEMWQPTVLVDFDGVIHRYGKGWQDGSTYDDPMEGAKETLQELTDIGYNVVIFTTRDSGQIYEYLRKYQFPRYRVTNVKEPAVAMIDDRAIHFTDWTDAKHQLLQRYPLSKDD